MRKHFHSARDLFLPAIDFFYPLFRRLMPLKTFRYAVCGAINTATGFVVYYITFKYILKAENLDLGFYVFTAYTSALMASFFISFPFGFFLMKYIVFSDSNLGGRIQLFRYFLGYLINLALNYMLLRITVEMLHIYPTIAQMITVIILILFSYIFQQHFTFRIKSATESLKN